jgi:hypothetical protein
MCPKEQEFSVPEVVSHLMGWGDHFISHFFITIYLECSQCTAQATISAYVNKVCVS